MNLLANTARPNPLLSAKGRALLTVSTSALMLAASHAPSFAAAQQTAAVCECEEGSPEFFCGSAGLAEAVAGGQVEHPDTDNREED